MAAAEPDLPRRELVLDAVLFLMTKHAQAPCPIVQRAIVMHMDMLARYPAARTDPNHRQLLLSLCTAWARMPAAADRPSLAKRPDASDHRLH